MPRQRFVVAGAEDTPYRGRASADGMLPAKKADMTITAMSAFPYLPVCGDLPVPEGISYARRTGGPAEPAGLFSRFPQQYTMSEPAGKGQIRAKFFGVEGEREGEAAPFVHKRGASPSHHLFMVS